MALVKRHAYEACFKLQAIDYVAENGNRAILVFSLYEAAIRTRTTVAQQLPADYQERVAIFCSDCRDKITVPSHINNMDEVLLTFDIPLTHTVERKKGPARWQYAQEVVVHHGSWLPRKRTERWMMEGEHSFTKRQRQASYATICGWIVDAWAMIPSLCIVRAFTKGGINAEAEPVGESDSDDEEEEFGMLDIEIAQLFNSDTEDESFDGIVAEE
ncbi:hypothetical protein D4764_19G0000030 [Takifugu flavidus]|uniref:Uncharacterized protein n=1 Tax=Takifugu flavidus TaxID=433684 RepID=A0A5C6NMP9_9TELE|nr:hypothetical protein D4764_19G0000030 [Takifugu flavidus]